MSLCLFGANRDHAIADDAFTMSANHVRIVCASDQGSWVSSASIHTTNLIVISLL